MDADLKLFLEGLESSILEEIQGSELKLREYVRAEIAGAETRLREHVEGVDARLATEFWKWANTSEMKLRQQAVNIGILEERLAALEARILDLESRGRGRVN